MVISIVSTVFKEETLKKYPNHNDEYLFYINILSLFPFVFLSSILWEEYKILSQVTSIKVDLFFGISTSISLWIVMLIFSICIYCSTSSYLILISTMGSLPVSILNTIRKVLLTFILSYSLETKYFAMQLVSSVFVCIGTFIYADIFRKISKPRNQ